MIKISNKNFVIGIAAIVVALLSWSWISQQGYLKINNSETVNANIEENANTQIEDIENLPHVRIIFPANQAVLNPNPLMVRYTVLGEIKEVNRVEMILYKQGETVMQRTGSFDPSSRAGSQLFPTLEEGEYRILARLVKNDGTYYANNIMEHIVMFQVKGTSATNN